jgi:gliding motility-associated-like protein
MKGLILIILISNSIFGQINLAPNPSFEIKVSCPEGANQYPLACSAWNMVSQSGGNGGTADYYNTCGGISFNDGFCNVSSTSGVPQNCSGFQYPRTGDGYCGFLAYVKAMQTVSYKEYVGAKLLNTLEENATYCVEFYVSLADSCNFAVDEIAAFFGPDSLPQVSFEPLNLVPQVINTTGVLDDKEDWMKITGYYTASGNEKYMFIGSYNDYPNTTIINLINEPLGDASNDNFMSAYYYIDDISICLQQSGVCQCEMNVSEDTNSVDSDNFNLDYELPNIFSPNNDLDNDVWTTNFLKENEYVIIMNRWGNEITRLNLQNPLWDGMVDGRRCSDGIYFYFAWMRDSQKTGFIQVVH